MNDPHGLPPKGTPKNYLVAWVLVLLGRSHLHGYEIARELREEIGLELQPGAVYRALRGLEAGGFIRSHWAGGVRHGSSRRVYELTETGAGALDAWGDALGVYRASLEKFFHVYHGIITP